MNNLLKFCLAVCLFSLMVACGSGEFREEPSVVFVEPQPEGEDNLAAFPLRLKGKYRGMAENNQLSITDKFIISTSVFEDKIPIVALDSNLRLNGDTITDLKSGEKTKVILQGDSIMRSFTFTDTVFRLNYDNVLRKFRGHYFLNTRYEGENWDVKQLSPEGSRLIIGSIRSQEDIQNLQAISEAPADTSSDMPRRFHLSKKQFRKYLGREGFRDQSIYIRESGLR
jgi:hypothetical protein